MASAPTFTKPVVILGAPRSGTSLLHRILRAQPGFVSLAGESAMIWRPLTHPAYNDWEYEGWQAVTLAESERLAIHRELARQALGAGIWRRVDTQGVGAGQHRGKLLGRLAGPGYRVFAFVLSQIRGNTSRRLVEKSVHNGLWLDLLDQVFPDAAYVHIVRRPEDNLRSMIQGWLHPDRFFTYELPVTLRIGGYPYQHWNFALPPGWRDYVNCALEEVVAFQWAALHSRSLEFTRALKGRSIRVGLEDLASHPGLELERLADFLQIPWNRHLESFAAALPRVNQSDRPLTPTGAARPPRREAIKRALEPYESLTRAIGY